MKIPTSSSIILATLAISSSSASLAAPTGDGTTAGGISQVRDDYGQPHQADQAMENEERADTSLMGRELDLMGVLEGLPVVGPLLKAVQASENPEDIQRLQVAVDTVSSAMSGLIPSGVPIPDISLPIPTGSLPGPGANPSGSPSDTASSAGAATPDAVGDPTDNGSTFLISPTTTVANAEEAAPTQDSEYLSSTPASGDGTPTSPGVPSGPPNTPVPVNPAPTSD